MYSMNLGNCNGSGGVHYLSVGEREEGGWENPVSGALLPV